MIKSMTSDFINSVKRGKFMRKVYLVAAATALLAACATYEGRPEAYCGTFEGMTSTASGEKVLTTIQLNQNKKFNSITQYGGQPDSIFTEQGNYVVNGNTVKIVPLNGEPAYFLVEKNQLRRLDSQRHLTTGSWAKNYVLKRTSCCK